MTIKNSFYPYLNNFEILHSQIRKKKILIYISDRYSKYLPDGELNPGLPRDRRGYLPLYYRG